MPSINAGEELLKAMASPEFPSPIQAVAENAELVCGRTKVPSAGFASSAGNTVSRSPALYTTNSVPAATLDHRAVFWNVITPELLSSSFQPRASEFFRNRISTHSFEPPLPWLNSL